MIARPGQTFISFTNCAARLLAALAVLAASPAAAQSGQTTWRAAGGFEVTGTLLGHDGTYLRLGTAAGPITINPAGLICDGAACPEPGLPAPIWRIVGAPRIGQTLLPSLIEGFAFASGHEALRTDTAPGAFSYDITDRVTGATLGRFAFELSSSTAALQALQAHTADAGLHLGTVPELAVSAARQSGLGDLGRVQQVHILALDALVPIVSPRLDARQVSLGDLAAAYGSTVRNWSELGGPGAPILPHLDGSDHAAWFERTQIPGGASLGAVTRLQDPAELLQAVATPGALGIAPYRSFGDTKPLPLAGTCGVALAADPVTLRTGDYPLTVPLVLVLPERRRPALAEAFLRWLKTDRAAAVVRRVGFVDTSSVPIPISSQGARLAEAIARAGIDVTLPELQAMIAAFDGRARLSPTFRFEGESMDLDLPSIAAIEGLARDIAAGRFDDRTLLLAGFSDGQAGASVSRAVSGARAEAVMAQLVGALGGSLPDGVRLRIRAFGEALPIGCDDTAWGRRLNQRVELWVAR